VNTFLRLAVLTAFLSQASAQGPTRIGELGRRLSYRALADVERIALANGGKPWLLNGEVRQIECVEAYFPPTTHTPTLRRGSMVTMFRQPVVRTEPRGPWEWALFQKDDYAQVRLSDRAFEQFTGDQDPNRPFRVLGQFSDEEVASLATLIRSSPVLASDAGGRSAVNGTWPILSIGRERDGRIAVRLRATELSGQLVWVRQQEAAWVILDIWMWQV
jgi:hypothetical protein